MNEFEVLAARVTRGDPRAAELLRKELQPQLRCIVGHTLRSGTADTPLARRILAEARTSSPCGEEGLAERIASRLCAGVVARLEARPAVAQRHVETVRI